MVHGYMLPTVPLENLADLGSPAKLPCVGPRMKSQSDSTHGGHTHTPTGTSVPRESINPVGSQVCLMALLPQILLKSAYSIDDR
jgi:hypothetical protein